MKKRFFAVLTAAALLFCERAYSFESVQCIQNIGENDVDVEAYSAIVVELKSGRVLYGKNVNQKLPMASTTKILTTIIALEQPDITETFKVNAKDITVEGSSMGLRDGDEVSLETLAYGMVLPSGNDAANATAVKIAGSKEKFAELMNEKAEEIGMYDSHFVTPSGLDADDHYSTAYDMAKLTCYAMKNEKFRDICSKYTQRIMLGDPPTERTLTNYNKLLNMYDYCIGVKTGYTENAGRCLVTAASKNGVELAVITMNCRDDFRSHIKLYDYYFDRLNLYDLSDFTDNITVSVAGYDRKLKAVPTDIPLVPLFEGEREKLTQKTTLKNIVYPPVEEGELLGGLEIYLGEELIYKTDLISGAKANILNKKQKIDFNLKRFMLKYKEK